MTKKAKSRIQVVQMSFLCNVADLSLRDEVMSSIIEVKPQFLHIKVLPLRFSGHEGRPQGNPRREFLCGGIILSLRPEGILGSPRSLSNLTFPPL